MILTNATPCPIRRYPAGGIPRNGLIAEWLGADSLADTSGNGYDLIATGGISYADGNIGRCFQLNGTSQYLQAPSGANLADLYGQNITMGMWIKIPTRNWSGNTQFIGSQGVQNNATAYQEFWSYGSGFNLDAYTFSVRRDNNSQTITSGNMGDIVDNTWHYIMFTKSGVTFTMYYDNIQMWQGSFSVDGHTADNPMTIGCYYQRYVAGYFNNIRFYNRVLTADEKTALFNET